MRDYSPKPLVEQHYHIQDLINAQEKRVSDRNYHRNQEKERADREDTINKAQLFVMTDFWCDKCKQDFKSQSIKEIEQDWYSGQRNAFYRSKCDKGHWCIRLITDKLKDGFWMKSTAIAKDRGKHFADLLQPGETNYNMLYGKK